MSEKMINVFDSRKHAVKPIIGAVFTDPLEVKEEDRKYFSDADWSQMQKMQDARREFWTQAQKKNEIRMDLKGLETKVDDVSMEVGGEKVDEEKIGEKRRRQN